MAAANMLPDELWVCIVSFAAPTLTSAFINLDECRSFARLALVSKPTYLATYDERRRAKRRVRVVVLRDAYPKFSTVGASRVLHLVVANGARYQLPWEAGIYGFRPSAVDWKPYLTPFANIVRLDLSRMGNDHAPEILKGASHVCRRVRALVLPDRDPEQPKQYHYIENLFEGAIDAMRRWRRANGGLVYLSLGRLVDYGTQAPHTFEVLGHACPRLEVLVGPDDAVLQRKWVPAWTAFWRACRNLRESNCALPVCTQTDLNQFAVVAKPQLMHLRLFGFNFAWAGVEDGDPEAMAQFVRAVPALQCLRLEARPWRRVGSVDLICYHGLPKLPRLESVTVVVTSLRARHGRRSPQPGRDIPLVSPRGLLALAACTHIKTIHIQHAVLDVDTLGALVTTTLARRVRRREIHLGVVHCDRDVVVALLRFCQSLPSDTLTHCVSLKLRVENLDAFVGPLNRACDERHVRALVAETVGVRDGLDVRVDLRTPLVDFVSDRSGFIVGTIALNVGTHHGSRGGVVHATDGCLWTAREWWRDLVGMGSLDSNVLIYDG